MKPQALNVSVIVTRDSEILSADHVRDETMFDDGNVALAYQLALNEWVALRPDPADPGAWRPTEIVEVPTPFDAATELSAKLGEIITPREEALFHGLLDADPEAIAAAAEHRPYDAWAQAS